MEVLLPCKLGEEFRITDTQLSCFYGTLKGVNWFNWSTGMQYTYVQGIKSKWTSDRLFPITEKELRAHDLVKETFTIPDKMLIDSPLVEMGLPLKGTGYVLGIRYKEGKVYYDILYTSEYFAHVYVSVDNKNIIVPPTWSKEKREGIILSKYKGQVAVVNEYILSED